MKDTKHTVRQKRLDRPELREKIAKLDYMWRFCGIPDEYETEWEKEGELVKQNSRAFAREVLALLPGTEEAKREERERIKKDIKKIITEVGIYSELSYQLGKYLQALKGGKNNDNKNSS